MNITNKSSFVVKKKKSPWKVESTRVPNIKKHDEEAEIEWIEGWDNMALLANCSSRNLQKKEKNDPTFPEIVRIQQGKRARVKIKISELEAWIHTQKSAEEEKRAASDQKSGQKAQASVGIRFIWAGLICIVIIIGFLAAYYVSSLNHTQKGVSQDIYKVSFTKPGTPPNNQLCLLDEDNRVLRELWSSFNRNRPLTEIDYRVIENSYVIVPPSKNQAARVLSVAGNSWPTLHTYSKARKISMPKIVVEDMNGIKMSDFETFYFVDWIVSEKFRGWIIGANCLDDYPGALLFFDEHFNLLVKLFNPGHVYSGFSLGDSYFFSASLNAREEEHQPYRAALVKVSIEKLLSFSNASQLRPFSESTIPTLTRRFEYILKEIPVFEPEDYLAWELTNRKAPPMFPAKDIFIPIIMRRKSLNRFTFFYRLGTTGQVRFVFDKKLNLLRKQIREHEWPERFNAKSYKESIGFRYWAGDHWGPSIKTDFHQR